jgi:hypothetical protein
MMGDSLAPTAGTSVQFVLKITGLVGAHAEVVRDGEATSILDRTPVKEASETRTFDYVADGRRHWIRVNVRGEDGSLLILGNPIYLNF